MKNWICSEFSFVLWFIFISLYFEIRASILTKLFYYFLPCNCEFTLILLSIYANECLLSSLTFFSLQFQEFSAWFWITFVQITLKSFIIIISLPNLSTISSEAFCPLASFEPKSSIFSVSLITFLKVTL